ncbi:Rv3235 family protein [Actinoplanes sp. NPDC051859]|uniref:Rv3235 family protein n=1 Tax=Actinoplanes sp. NPDC051859 TaxID=3363909 RepID=UPI0037881FF2
MPASASSLTTAPSVSASPLTTAPSVSASSRTDTPPTSGLPTAMTPASAPSPTPASALPRVQLTAPTGLSPDARLAVRRFVNSCVEVLNGYRPAAHLRKLAKPREAAAVVAQGVAAANKITQARKAAHARRQPPHRPSRTNARQYRPAPVAVLCSSVCEPRPGAVEAAVVLIVGDRTLAMAFRLELEGDAWLATVFHLI